MGRIVAGRFPVISLGLKRIHSVKLSPKKEATTPNLTVVEWKGLIPLVSFIILVNVLSG